MSLLGQRFRQVREERGISVLQAEIDTRIRAGVIQALEEGNSDNLPPEPFLRGLIRSYANYLKLDPQEMLDLYTADISPAPPPVVAAPVKRPAAVPHPPTSRPSLETLVDTFQANASDADNTVTTPEQTPPIEQETYTPPSPPLPRPTTPKPYIPQPPGPIAPKNRRLKPPPALFQRRPAKNRPSLPAEPPAMPMEAVPPPVEPSLPPQGPEPIVPPSIPFKSEQSKAERPKSTSPSLVETLRERAKTLERAKASPTSPTPPVPPPAPTTLPTPQKPRPLASAVSGPESLGSPESLTGVPSLRQAFLRIEPALVSSFRTFRNRPLPVPAFVLLGVALIAACGACGLFAYAWMAADNPSTAQLQPTMTRTRNMASLTPVLVSSTMPTRVPTLPPADSSDDRTPVPPAAPSPTLKPTIEHTNTPTVKSALNLDLKATQTITIQVGVDGTMVFSGPIAPGTSRSWSASKSLYVRVENPLGATILFNGNNNWFKPLVLAERTVIARAWTASPSGKVTSTTPVPPSGGVPEASGPREQPVSAPSATPAKTSAPPRGPTPTLTPFS